MDASTLSSFRLDSVLRKRARKENAQVREDMKMCKKTEINKGRYITHQNLQHVKALYLSLNVFLMILYIHLSVKKATDLQHQKETIVLL